MKADKIAILDVNRTISVKPKHLEILKQTAPGCEFVLVDNPADLISKAPGADAMILWPFVGPDLIEYIRQTTSLRWLHLFTSGVDYLMNSEAGRIPGFRVSSTKGIHGYPISDHVLALIYAFLRQLHTSARSQQERNWASKALSAACREIAGQTVGIVGVGNIGLEVARKCKLLGMTVLGTKRQPIASEWLDVCYPVTELNSLLEKSDFVILCLPLTPESRHIIGRRELASMKKNAILINIARGGVVDQNALIESLANGQIAGAGLDVTDPEPLPEDSPLWGMPNVIITPHISAQSPQYMDRAINVIAENLRRFLADEPLLNEVWRNGLESNRG